MLAKLVASSPSKCINDYEGGSTSFLLSATSSICMAFIPLQSHQFAIYCSTGKKKKKNKIKKIKIIKIIIKKINY